MQQPTSFYYLASYGAYLQASSDNERFLLRAIYIERPEFKANGYTDQDYGSFALLGSKLKNWKWHGVYAFFGYGNMSGFIKTNSDHESSEQKERTYSIDGLSACLEYRMRLGGFDIGIDHQTFVGSTNQEQLNARVAWPYNFLKLNIGYRI